MGPLVISGVTSCLGNHSSGRCQSEWQPVRLQLRMVLVTGLVAEANLDTLSLKLVEGIGEVAAVAHGDHIAVLALGDREAERERAGDIAATALPERRGGQDLALAVLHGDLGVAADIRVAIRSLARCPVRCDRADVCIRLRVGQHESA